jgi:hypothetical protein
MPGALCFYAFDSLKSVTYAFVVFASTRIPFHDLGVCMFFKFKEPGKTSTLMIRMDHISWFENYTTDKERESVYISFLGAEKSHFVFEQRDWGKFLLALDEVETKRVTPGYVASQHN